MDENQRAQGGLNERLANIQVSVKAFGAAGDGVTNDSAAVLAAQTALPTEGGVVYFPAGTYLLSSGLTLTRSNITYRGAGMFASTVKRTTATIMEANPAIENVAFEDLGFAGDGTVTNGLVFYRRVAGQIRVSRCRFYRMGTAGVNLQGPGNVLIEGCLFHSAGDAKGIGVNMAQGMKNVTIRNNQFLWLQSGIIIDTGSTSSQSEAVTENLVIDGNLFDLGWWALTARFSGSGGTVTYAATTVTDTGAAFTGLSANDTVRAMAVKETGTGTTTLYNRIIDAAATFTSAGVRRGDIVRMGSAFAIVANVEAETILRVEDWLSDTNRLPIAIPDSGTYTVYGVQFGKISSATSTVITVDRWHDFDGTAGTPSNGTLYEVLAAHPNYPFNCEYSTRKMRVVNNTFRRGWSDQVSIFGFESIIANNLIEDGQDMGITLHGQDNIIEGNIIRHQGAGGIFMSGDDSVIANNVFENTPWVNVLASPTAGYQSHIIIYDGNRNVISGNRGTVGAVTDGQYGMAIYGTGGPLSAGNLVIGNYFDGHITADILVRGVGSTATRLVHNVGVVLVDDSAALYVTDNKGTGSIASGATTAVVSHGLSETPTAANIHVVFTENPTTDNGNVWITSVTSTQFTVNVRTDPGASNLDFAWRAFIR